MQKIKKTIYIKLNIEQKINFYKIIKKKKKIRNICILKNIKCHQTIFK